MKTSTSLFGVMLLLALVLSNLSAFAVSGDLLASPSWDVSPCSRTHAILAYTYNGTTGDSSARSAVL